MDRIGLANNPLVFVILKLIVITSTPQIIYYWLNWISLSCSDYNLYITPVCWLMIVCKITTNHIHMHERSLPCHHIRSFWSLKCMPAHRAILFSHITINSSPMLPLTYTQGTICQDQLPYQSACLWKADKTEAPEGNPCSCRTNAQTPHSTSDRDWTWETSREAANLLAALRC